MHFIRTCNGQFKKEKLQNEYDEIKDGTKSATAALEQFLFDTVRSKLKGTDIHHDLIVSMMEVSQKSLDLAQNSVIPMTLDLYEYALKNHDAKSLAEKLKGHEKDDVNKLFAYLSGKLNYVASVLQGRQTPESLFNFFNKFTDEEIRNELSRDIQDKDLLDGFMAFRSQHGYFIKQLYDGHKNYAALFKGLNHNESQKFCDRWNSITKLITKDLYPLKQAELEAEQLSRVKDQKAANFFRNFGILDAANANCKIKLAQLEKDLNELFDPFQVADQQSTSSTSQMRLPGIAK